MRLSKYIEIVETKMISNSTQPHPHPHQALLCQNEVEANEQCGCG